MSVFKHRPGKIVCVGRNYREHAKELGNEVPREPLLFLKPPSSVVWEGEAIVLPTASSKVEHEGEIGVVVGKNLSRVSEGEAARGIRAIIAVNDVTARDLQKTDGQNVRVSLNDDAQIYRRGQQVEYRDVEPNDVIQVRQAS